MRTAQLWKGLAGCHRLGITHHNRKPASMLLMGHDSPNATGAMNVVLKVADLRAAGLAASVEDLVNPHA